MTARHTRYAAALCMFRARYYANYSKWPSVGTLRQITTLVLKRLKPREQLKMTRCAYCQARMELLSRMSQEARYLDPADVVRFLVDTGVIVPQYPLPRSLGEFGFQDALSAATVLGLCVPDAANVPDDIGAESFESGEYDFSDLFTVANGTEPD